MMFVVVLAFALSVCLPTISAMVSSAALSRQLSLEHAWSMELESSSENQGEAPVKRVIELLGKMKAELESETGKESETYDKMVCWCETTEKEKTKAIADADSKELELQSEIESRAAKAGELSTEIAQMKKEISEGSAALKESTAIREREAAEFKGSEQDLVQAITNLKNAIAVLERHQSASLLQLSPQMRSGLRVVLRDVAYKHEALLAHSSPRTAFVAVGSATYKRSGTEERSADLVETSSHTLLTLLNDKLLSGAAETTLPLKFAEHFLHEAASQVAAVAAPASFLQTSAAKQPLYQSYATRSDTIFGVLKQMLEDFEAQLSSSQKDDATMGQNHAELAKAKEEEVTIGKEKLDSMEVEHASNQKALTDAKEFIEATRNQRSADVEFLRNLKLSCNDLDAEWDKRSKTRAAELKAVTETITILTEDESREQLVKGGVALVQTSQSAASTRNLRSNVARVLRQASRAPDFDAEDLLAAWRGRGHQRTIGAVASPRAQLSTLAVAVQLDSFEKVKEMMDKLVAELKKQQEEEVAFKAYCVKEFDQNEKATHAKTTEKEDLEANIDQREATLTKLGEEIADAKAQIAGTETEIKQAGEVREKENSAFQITISDQRATQDILKKALLKLEDFYKKGLGNAVFVQQQRLAQNPAATFNAYKVNAGSSPVMGLIEQIIEDSKALEADATAAESSAQSNYEAMVKSSTALIGDLSAAVTAKTKASATAKEELGEAKGSHTFAVEELDSLSAYEEDLHQECDFVMKNFAIRQKARLQEIEAIQGAKGILSGAK